MFRSDLEASILWHNVLLLQAGYHADEIAAECIYHNSATIIILEPLSRQTALQHTRPRAQQILAKSYKIFCHILITYFGFIVHIYSLFTRKRIVSLSFGRDVRTRLGVAISEVFETPVLNITVGVSR